MYDYVGKNAEYCVFPMGEGLGTEELKIFMAQIFRKRTEMKIRIRTLPNTELKKIFQQSYKKYKFVKIKYTPQEFPTGIFIFKDHILNVVWGEKPIAFLVKSEKNYECWQKFFEEQWEKAKP